MRFLKTLALATVLAGAAMLSGCASIAGGIIEAGSGKSIEELAGDAGKAALDAAKSPIDREQAYQAAAGLTIKGARSGLMSAKTADDMKSIDLKLYLGMLLLRVTYDATKGADDDPAYRARIADERAQSDAAHADVQIALGNIASP